MANKTKKIDWKSVAEIAIGIQAGMLLSTGINWTIDKNPERYRDFTNKEHCKILFGDYWKLVYDSVKKVNQIKKQNSK